MNRAEWLLLSDERDLHEQRWRRAFREGYAAGEQRGYERGYQQAHDDLAAAQRIQHGRLRDLASGPSFGDLQYLRWGPGGREHYADPRPGDFPGREADSW